MKSNALPPVRVFVYGKEFLSDECCVCVCHMNIGESSVDLAIREMLLLLQDSWLRLFPTWCCMLTCLCYFLHIVHESTYILCFWWFGEEQAFIYLL